MTKDLKKRTMEDLQTAMKDYSYWKGMLEENARELKTARARVVELEGRYTELEAKMHAQSVAALEMAHDIKAGK